MGLGYTRAARIMDQLEAEGVIGPSQGAKAREIYLPNPNGAEPEPTEQSWNRLKKVIRCVANFISLGLFDLFWDKARRWVLLLKQIEIFEIYQKHQCEVFVNTFLRAVVGLLVADIFWNDCSIEERGS